MPRGIPEGPVWIEEIFCPQCGQETPHKVVRYSDGCVGICPRCASPQVCPCTPEEVAGAHLWKACPWHRP